MILGNKIDLENALPYKELVSALGLEGVVPEEENEETSFEDNNRPIRLFQCSLVEGSGYGQAFKWLSDIL